MKTPSPTHSWQSATEQAIKGMSSVGARERARHARQFAMWMEARGRAPEGATRGDIAAFVEWRHPNRGNQADKVRCSLRAVLGVIDPIGLSHRAGLGNQSSRLSALDGTPLGMLVERVVDQQPARRAVRRSAIGRLLAWAASVDVDPLRLDHGDLGQFRRWLQAIPVGPGEIVVVARDLLDLRHSPDGRQILGEPEPQHLPTRIEVRSPLSPRFHLADVMGADQSGPRPARAVIEPWARPTGD